MVVRRKGKEMSREENIKNACAKVRKIYDKMNKSCDIEYLRHRVYINPRLSIVIECERTESARP